MDDTSKLLSENKAFNEGRIDALEWALRLIENNGRFGLDKVVKAIKEEVQNVTKTHLL